MSLVLPMYEASTPLPVSRQTAMMLCTGYLLACFTPVLTGLGRDIAGDYREPFLVLATMSAAMSLLALRLAPRRDLAAASTR
jgi:CP family cyanate transporter-like MFS transporter